jgi:hypothetical protein
MRILRISPLNLLTLSLASALVILAAQVLVPNKAEAAYDGGRLIDDSVFLDAGSMSKESIQSFLSSRGAGLASMNFPMDCDAAGQQAKQAYLSIGAPCGNQNVPASHLIYYSSQIYGLNPKVILATMQKEQSLTTAPNPTSWQLSQAMGYGCPTSGSCSSSSNFFYQIDNGTWVLRFHYERARGNMTWWYTSTSWTCGTEKQYYKPNLYPKQNVDFYDQNNVYYRTHYIFNAATSAMYCYTPHAYNNPQGLYGRPPFGSTGMYYSGSYNFVYFFELWFGSVTGAHYAWNIESFTLSGGDNSITQGQTETITLRARNIGLVPWYNHGNHPIRLATWEPADRTSSLFNSNRLATLQESVVQPGEVGTFTFQLTPQNPGTFSESLNLVAENYTFAQWPGFRPTIVVPRAYEWQLQNVIYENGTGVMNPGEQQLVTVIAKNTGSATWSKTSGPQIRLATWQPDRISSVGTGWISQTRVGLMNETSVAPGQNAGFQFYVRMPRSGVFYERLNLVAEGQSWFNDSGLTLYLEGRTFLWQPLWHSHSTGTANIPRNTEFTLTIKVKNTGTMTWTKDGNFPVRLATVAPQDRGSGLYDTSWIRDTRPTSLVENSVAPGQEGTFVFTVRAHSTPGQRIERFSLVAEGVSWFNDPGFGVYVNVL